jgi:hypothetical protein
MIKVAKLPLGQIGEAARLLARAFSVDPILTFFLSDPVRRKVAFPAFFRALIYETWECGHVYGAMLDERLAGVSVWVPPDPAPPSRPFRRRADRNHLLVKAVFRVVQRHCTAASRRPGHCIRTIPTGISFSSASLRRSKAEAWDES